MKNKLINFLFCCLNSRRSIFIEKIIKYLSLIGMLLYLLNFVLLPMNLLNTIYIIFIIFSFLCLLWCFINSILFIRFRRKNSINDYLNFTALVMSSIQIVISIANIIQIVIITFNIYNNIKIIEEKHSVSKGTYSVSFLIYFILIFIWLWLLKLWSCDTFRLYLKTDDSYINYKTSQSINSHFNKLNEEQGNKITHDLIQLDSKSDSLQKPVHVQIIGNDELGNPVYDKIDLNDNEAKGKNENVFYFNSKTKKLSSPKTEPKIVNNIEEEERAKTIEDHFDNKIII